MASLFKFRKKFGNKYPGKEYPLPTRLARMLIAKGYCEAVELDEPIQHEVKKAGRPKKQA